MRNDSFMTMFAFVVNAIVGTGIFINTSFLMKNFGLLSWQLYGIVGILFIPLVLICYELAFLFPGYSLFDIIANQTKKPAFVLSGYVLGKLATMTICLLFILDIFGSSYLNCKGWGNARLLFIFQMIWVFGICEEKVFSRLIQLVLFAFKLLPIIFIVLYNIFYSTTPFANLPIQDTSEPQSLFSIISMIPVIVFSYAGFELLFSLLNNIKTKSIDLGKAIVSGFLTVVFLYIIYQLNVAIFIKNYFQGNDITIKNLISSMCLDLPGGYYVRFILLLSVCGVAFGVAYNCLYAQVLNLKRLLNDNNKTDFKINTYNKFYWIIFGIIITYLTLYEHCKTLLVLQQISALGTMSIYCFLIYVYNKKILSKKKLSLYQIIIMILSIILVGIMIFSSVKNAYYFGYIGYLIFLISSLLLLPAIITYLK